MPLLDGGLGREIQKRSAQSAHALWSVKVMMEKPEIVTAVHRDYIDAGAGVLTINAYTATPSQLARSGVSEWFDEAQALAVGFANEARDESGKKRRSDKRLSAPYLSPVTRLTSAWIMTARSPCSVRSSPPSSMVLTSLSLKQWGLSLRPALLLMLPKVVGFLSVAFTLADDVSNTLRSGENLADAVAMTSIVVLTGSL